MSSIRFLVTAPVSFVWFPGACWPRVSLFSERPEKYFGNCSRVSCGKATQYLTFANLFFRFSKFSTPRSGTTAFPGAAFGIGNRQAIKNVVVGIVLLLLVEREKEKDGTA
jgi:hypothetical protein